MRVVAVDPAPAKGNTVFDGERFMNLAHQCTREFLDDPGPETLLCWAASEGSAH